MFIIIIIYLHRYIEQFICKIQVSVIILKTSIVTSSIRNICYMNDNIIMEDTTLTIQEQDIN